MAQVVWRPHPEALSASLLQPKTVELSPVAGCTPYKSGR